ncbi:MAG: NAD(+)/NADH kinase [Acidobacteria bacterium]|nr:NAD(+)/NADH kinase [Acidobacteriota bacterium]
MYEKIVIVTRKTRLLELIERFNSRGQAKFYIEHSGGDFSDYVEEDTVYQQSLDTLRQSLEIGLKLQVIDREFLPTFLFTEKDLIVTLGQDGLVANTAKYVTSQPIIAVNPDPVRFDGILLPFQLSQREKIIEIVSQNKMKIRSVTLAEVSLNDGQRLLAFNDLFIGAQTHISARYNIKYGSKTEAQSSSGVIVSTGAGSTGWLSSIFNMASSVTTFFGGSCGKEIKLAWEDPRLIFVVREPFISKYSRASLITGILEPGQTLVLESLMPSGGVIFSDGIERDYLPFNSGFIAKINASKNAAKLVVG